MKKKTDILERREEALDLYEAYGKLLTERESSLFAYYFSYDLSLSEIALNEHISRSAVSDSLQKSLEKLYDYERKLALVKKAEAIDKAIAAGLKGETKEKDEALTKIGEVVHHGV